MCKKNIYIISQIDLTKIGEHKFNGFTIEIVNSVDDYVNLLKEIFDFELIKNFLAKNPNYTVLFDGLHGGFVCTLPS